VTEKSAAIEGTVSNVETKPLDGEVQDAAHVLILGAHSFPCVDKMPYGTLLKYASAEYGALELYHWILVKLVRLPDEINEDADGNVVITPGSMDPVWDACDEIGEEETIKAINVVIATYSKRRPTSPASA
jgi:hypothetical protein